MKYIPLAIAIIVLIFSADDLIYWIRDGLCKCKSCDKRFNKERINGQYGCHWYECKCKRK